MAITLRKIRKSKIAPPPLKRPILLSSPTTESPDDAVFRQLAHAYSNGNDQMKKSTGCDAEDGFHDGITNGAQWYSVTGGRYT